jgi:hypothetical protein
VAPELLLGRFGDRFVQLHVIIIKEFLARLDVAQRINEDSVVFLDRFAVWIARMIDPARVVTANFRIDYIAVVQPEVESVRVVMVVGGGFPRDALACVFDDARAFPYDLCGVNAPAVHTGLANFDLDRALPRFAFLRHAQFWNQFLSGLPPDPYSSIAPLILRRCSRNVYFGSLARFSRYCAKPNCSRSVWPLLIASA